jgi:putative ABC transport system ATP-binding protein
MVAAMLEITALRKGFARPEGGRGEVIDVPALQLAAGEHLALRGASGSGKTTLLHLIAGILPADAGSIVVDHEAMTGRGEVARDRLRAAKIGCVFQAFHLLQGLTAEENVRLGMLFGPRGVERDRAAALLARVGLADRARYRPRQLSLGQQQRVAVARALAGRPRLVLADEPTGSLDRAAARVAVALIREVCREEGAALLLVSHDEEVLAGFERVEDLAFINRVTTVAGEDAA